MSKSEGLQFFKALYADGRHYLCDFSRSTDNEHADIYIVEVDIREAYNADFKNKFIVVMKEYEKNNWRIKEPNPSINREMECLMSAEINCRR